MKRTALVVRICARVLAGLLILLVGLIAVSEDPGSFDQLKTNEAVMLGMMAIAWLGLVLGLWRERLGGVTTLVGMTAFYGTNLIHSGRTPGGWVFPLFFVAAALYLVSWWSHRRIPES